jgi:hypothetical protein
VAGVTDNHFAAVVDADSLQDLVYTGLTLCEYSASRKAEGSSVPENDAD